MVRRHAQVHAEIAADLRSLRLAINRIDKNVRTIYPMMTVLFDKAIHEDPNIWKRAKEYGSSGGNPYDLGRRNELLDKYRDYMIAEDEAKELGRYLDEDRDRLKDDPAAVALMTGLAIGLAAYQVARAVQDRTTETLRRVRPK